MRVERQNDGIANVQVTQHILYRTAQHYQKDSVVAIQLGPGILKITTTFQALDSYGWLLCTRTEEDPTVEATSGQPGLPCDLQLDLHLWQDASSGYTLLTF